MKHFTQEIKIALVAIAGVVILFFGLQFLKGLSIFSTEDTYYIEFDDVSGLSSSSAILADGYKVGTVKSITFGYGTGVKSIAKIGIDQQMRIPKGSTAEIKSDMLGNTTVNLLLANNPRERVEAGDTISGQRNAGMLAKAGELIPQVEKIMPKLDSILGSLNTLLADPALANSLHNVEGITTNLSKATGDLKTMMATVNKELPELMAHTSNTMKNTDKMTSELAQVDLKATADKLDATLSNVHKLTEALQSKDGTLGLLLNDTELYNNLASTMASADSLLRDLKAHPKRYVHFSVFGKKDE